MTECGKSCGAAAESGPGTGLSVSKARIMVLSGKGGVGKSSIAACLALGLAEKGFRVGVIDVDFHGPSLPLIFGLEGERVFADAEGIYPARIGENLEIISIGFFLSHEDDAVIWRGPLKMTAIRQFIQEIHWSELDYLVIDSPPGTGDEPLSVAQLIPDSWGLIVTTPQELAMSDVRKSINFCRKVGMPLAGVVENMSGFKCPHCGKFIDIFGRGGAEVMAERMQVELLASIPLNKQFALWADQGGGRKGTYRDLETVSAALDAMVEKVMSLTSPEKKELTHSGKNPPEEPEGRQLVSEWKNPQHGKEEGLELFAIPTEGGILCSHFGHCEKFTLVEVGEEGKPRIKEVCDAPPHEPGLLPRWLAERGVTTVIAGGMGARAQRIFAESGVRVICGAPAMEPVEVVRGYLEGILELGENVCDH